MKEKSNNPAKNSALTGNECTARSRLDPIRRKILGAAAFVNAVDHTHTLPWTSAKKYFFLNALQKKKKIYSSSFHLAGATKCRPEVLFGTRDISAARVSLSPFLSLRCAPPTFPIETFSRAPVFGTNRPVAPTERREIRVSLCARVHRCCTARKLCVRSRRT